MGQAPYSPLALCFRSLYYTTLLPCPPSSTLQDQVMYARRITLGLVLLVAFPVMAIAQGPAWWPQWRGPSGQGVADDAKVPLEWSATKNLLWKTPLPGPGHSTPVIWGERAFLTASNASGVERFVVCVRTTDGKILWQKTAHKGPPERTHSTGSHANASCATDGKLVFAFFGSAGLFCFDIDGNPLWKKSFGILTSEEGWGTAASPVLFEDLVIQNCDNDGPDFLPKGESKESAAPAALIAIDKRTGKIAWQTPRNQGRGFSTPVLIKTPEGRLDLVLNGPGGVWGYDPRTGKETWHVRRHPEMKESKFGEPVPLFTNDMLYAPAGRDNGYFQAIRLGGSGDVTSTHVAWEVRRKSTRDIGSGVMVGDYLFYADARGAILTIHDRNSGKQTMFERTKGNKAFYASPILIQNRVLMLSMDGKTYVIEPAPTLKVERINTLSDGTVFCASPAVADGRLFLRSQTHLYCVGMK
jgi:outer membrane protein assembly factor BamB